MNKILYDDKSDLYTDPTIELENKVVAEDMNEIKTVVNSIVDEIGIINADLSLPIGTIIAYGGNSIPIGWLECNGNTFSQQDYPELYNVLGVNTLPNLKGRVVVGLDANDTDFHPIGKTGGSKDLQAHSHNVVSADNYPLNSFAEGDAPGYSLTSLFKTTTSDINQIKTTIKGTGDSGNLQPYSVYRYIIKALHTTPTPTPLPSTASVVNTHSTSTSDAYSCEYVNNAINRLENTLYLGTIPAKTGTIPKNGWWYLGNIPLTLTLEKGTYMITFCATFANANTGTFVATINPDIDNTKLNPYTRTSIPMQNGLLVSAQSTVFTSYDTDAQHTFNIQVYASDDIINIQDLNVYAVKLN